MKISVLCSELDHPIVPYLERWRVAVTEQCKDVFLAHDKKDLPGGDILFLVSCHQVLRPLERQRYKAAFVLHASDLPRGRGWSPHVWAIANGESEITVCLLEAGDLVDSGAVWLRRKFVLDGTELLPEINHLLFQTELDLMTEVIEGFGYIKPEEQIGEAGPSFRKRTPEDSRLDPFKSIAEQFDLLRATDPQRYPAFVDFRGMRYVIKIEKDITKC